MTNKILKKARKLRRNSIQLLSNVSHGTAPSFLIIGAQKSGTTSLYNMLDQHPDIQGSATKEVRYFSHSIHFGTTREEYEKNFRPLPFTHPKFFEATPAYIARPGVAQQIASHYPSIKLICILREPISRAFSAYNMYARIFENGAIDKLWKKGGKLPDDRWSRLRKSDGHLPAFRECIEFELDLIQNEPGAIEPSLLRRGFYLEQLKAYWDAFDRRQILVLGYSDLKERPQFVLDEVCDFLDVERTKREVNSDWSNKGSYKSGITDTDREFLSEIYREPNERLFAEIGHINW